VRKGKETDRRTDGRTNRSAPELHAVLVQLFHRVTCHCYMLVKNSNLLQQFCYLWSVTTQQYSVAVWLCGWLQRALSSVVRLLTTAICVFLMIPNRALLLPAHRRVWSIANEAPRTTLRRHRGSTETNLIFCNCHKPRHELLWVDTLSPPPTSVNLSFRFPVVLTRNSEWRLQKS